MIALDYFFSQDKNILQRQRAGLHIINELQRFRLLMTCLFCSISVSLVYTFELFATEFTSRFGLTAKELSTISTVGPCFCYFVVHYAILMEHIGPTPLLWWGCICGFIGILGLNLIFYGTIPGNMATICVFYAFMNMCSGLFDATSVPALVETFPRNRGPVLSLAKVMTGLGASVMSCLYRNLFPGNLNGYLFFLMAYAMVVSLVASFVLVLPPYIVNTWRGRGKTEDEKEALRSLSTVYFAKSVPHRRLAVGYVVAISLLVFMTVTAPITAYIDISIPARKLIGSLAIVIVCCFFIMILPIRWLGGVDEPSPYRAAEIEREQARADAANQDTPPSDYLDRDSDCIDEAQVLTAKEDELGVPDLTSMTMTMSYDGETDPARRFTEYTMTVTPAYRDPPYQGDIWVTLRNLDIYLILFGLILEGAIAVMVMYNSGTIYVARAGKPRSAGLAALYTAFMGVGSALGRIAVGVYEVYVQSQPAERRRFLVTMALPIPPLLGMIGGILILVLPADALLLPFILVYLKVGAFFSANAIVLSALWTTHHAVYYNLSPGTTVVSLICFNRFLFGSYVDKKLKEKQKNAAESGLEMADVTNCYGRDCITVPIAVATALAFCSFVLLSFAHWRYCRYVRRVEKERKEVELAEPSAPRTKNDLDPVAGTGTVEPIGEES